MELFIKRGVNVCVREREREREKWPLTCIWFYLLPGYCGGIHGRLPGTDWSAAERGEAEREGQEQRDQWAAEAAVWWRKLLSRGHRGKEKRVQQRTGRDEAFCWGKREREREKVKLQYTCTCTSDYSLFPLGRAVVLPFVHQEHLPRSRPLWQNLLEVAGTTASLLYMHVYNKKVDRLHVAYPLCVTWLVQSFPGVLVEVLSSRREREEGEDSERREEDGLLEGAGDELVASEWLVINSVDVLEQIIVSYLYKCCV